MADETDCAILSCLLFFESLFFHQDLAHSAMFIFGVYIHVLYECPQIWAKFRHTDPLTFYISFYIFKAHSATFDITRKGANKKICLPLSLLCGFWMSPYLSKIRSSWSSRSSCDVGVKREGFCALGSIFSRPCMSLQNQPQPLYSLD